MARIWPPNARVIRCSSSSRTSRAKSTPVAAAIARTASWTGLPSITPQVARGSPIRRALWSSRVVAMPASPGATILGPPLNPAKKCGSTKPVVIRRSAATHSRSSRTGTSPTIPKVDLARVVAGVVVLDSPLREHVVTQHRATLARGRCAMGAGGDQDDDVLRSDDAVERFHDRPEHEGPGLGSRDVAHGDRDALTRSGDLPERWPGHRLGDRPPQRRRGVRRCCSGPWPDHRGRVRGQLDRQTRRPVGEVHRDPIVPAVRLDHSSTTRLPGAVHATVHEHTGAWLIRRLPVIPHAFGTARSRGTDLEHLLGVAVRDPHGSGAGDCSERRAGNWPSGRRRSRSAERLGCGGTMSRPDGGGGAHGD